MFTLSSECHTLDSGWLVLQLVSLYGTQKVFSWYVYIVVEKFVGLYLTPFSSYPIHLLSYSFIEAVSKITDGKMKNTGIPL